MLDRVAFEVVLRQLVARGIKSRSIDTRWTVNLTSISQKFPQSNIIQLLISLNVDEEGFSITLKHRELLLIKSMQLNSTIAGGTTFPSTRPIRHSTLFF